MEDIRKRVKEMWPEFNFEENLDSKTCVELLDMMSYINYYSKESMKPIDDFIEKVSSHISKISNVDKSEIEVLHTSSNMFVLYVSDEKVLEFGSKINKHFEPGDEVKLTRNLYDFLYDRKVAYGKNARKIYKLLKKTNGLISDIKEIALDTQELFIELREFSEKITNVLQSRGLGSMNGWKFEVSYDDAEKWDKEHTRDLLEE